MTELKVRFTKGFVKRAAAVAMAVCLGATLIPADYAVSAGENSTQAVGDTSGNGNGTSVGDTSGNGNGTSAGDTSGNGNGTSEGDISGNQTPTPGGETPTPGGETPTPGGETPGGTPAAKVEVAAVALDKTAITFDKIGATQTLTATVTPDNATDKTVTWSSSNEKVATVDNGVVKAVGNGTAAITAKAGGKEAAATVTVSQKSDKVAITLNGQTVKGNLNVKVKKSYTFKAEVTPKNTDAKNAKVSWSTSNKKVATVSSKGKVTIQKAGTAKITAKTADGKKAVVTLKASTKVVKVTKLAIKGDKTMKVKKSQTLKVTVTPATADNQKVTWKSSDTKIATVNSKGKVTAKKKGTVKITATAKDGSKKKATITIKVK